MDMKRIGFIGLGVMGGGIAGTLLKAGYDLTIWGRNPDQGKPLIKLGAKAAPTIAGAMKLVGNLIVASQLQALGEAMVLATKAGLDPQDVLGVLEVTDFRSPILSGVGAALVKRDFSMNFALKHLLRDANLIDRFAQDLNSPIPALAAIRETIKSAVNQGWGEENASAMIKAIEMDGHVQVGGLAI